MFVHFALVKNIREELNASMVFGETECIFGVVDVFDSLQTFQLTGEQCRVFATELEVLGAWLISIYVKQNA